ncbi:tRNA adenosine deaminase [Rhodococcus sp. PAMC28707]|uniref:tRNA adenosine deaminase-associated protein n=1 Tax=unclassified Rhodococcus (in: high G+C Gram-positive bacteria) TaxID=192944 RepID=UPI00109DD88B|nr:MULTISPECIES: tRNA adenosine deaminase-associated protein [unclassified Rhodococcus (in: high G+C Gram-positive bacteria)]QCB49315.1 tRNA adenosine deaminase [Rhodococcus sp. PAMC28705]QCB58997.1 tRNA adenosine deaminase [Rhodococcus sp. PAMC28707]
MAAQRGSNSSAEAKNDDGPNSNSYDDLDGFGVAVVREDGKWRVTPLPMSALTSLSAAETELREMRSSGAVFGLLDIDDEFFVILRPAPSGTHLLISDATAAIDYDIAAEVLDALNVDIPDIDPDDLDDIEPWEEGNLALLADLGLPEAVLGIIVAETDLYPDEQLGSIAERLGFPDELAAVLDKLSR